jgi:hypothetical protein
MRQIDARGAVANSYPNVDLLWDNVITGPWGTPRKKGKVMYIHAVMMNERWFVRIDKDIGIVHYEGPFPSKDVAKRRTLEIISAQPRCNGRGVLSANKARSSVCGL